ncbi:MAG: FAD-binding oxidoreductase [Pseudomonadota bacterium]
MSIFAPEFVETPYWWDAAKPEALAGDEPGNSTPTDVIVIGSGYAGLSCALELARAGTEVLVVDAGEIGIGASTRAAGLLSGRAGISKQINLEAQVGAARSAAMLDEADEAYDHFQQIVTSPTARDAGFQRTGRFVAAHTPAAYEKLAIEAEEYNSDGRGAFKMVPRDEQHAYIASDFYFGGMYTDAAGLVHPALYHRVLLDACRAAGVHFASHCRVTAISRAQGKCCLATERGSLEAHDVVLATNGYTDSAAPWHQRRLIPISSTMVASAPLGRDAVAKLLPKGCAVIDAKRVIAFARPSPDGTRLLFGGRARFHPTTLHEATNILHAQMREILPELADVQVTHAWTGKMGFTFDFLPKIGEHQGIHYALGCNGGCGIVMMTWLGREVGRKLAGTTNRTSAFDNQHFKTQPFYAGKPWFLPVVGNYYRFRDWLELRGARRFRNAATR